MSDFKDILVGTVGYPVRNKNFLRDIDVLEMDDAKYIPPGRKAALKIHESLGEDLKTVVQISRYFVNTPRDGITLKGKIENYGNFQLTDESLKLWERQIDFAKGLNAAAMVLITPPNVTPSFKTVTAMGDFLKKVDRAEMDIIWEPHGPWEREYIEKFAADHNLVLAVDPLRDPVPDGKLVYFRLGAFAAGGSRMGVYDLEQIAAAALESEADKIFCVFETQRALDDAKNLKQTLLSVMDGDDDFDEFDY
jgi:uncharacterized protein YecE (DUF72 family)